MATVNECGIAAKQSATCTQKCKTCQREGIPILPLRYAVIPKDKAKDRALMGAAVLAGGKPISAPLGDGLTDKKLTEHAYSVRVLRQGFLYVFIEKTKIWQAYGVKPSGLLSQFADPTNPPADAQKEMSFACKQAGDNVPAAFINIPDISNTPKIWIAYSSIVWTKKVLESYASNAKLREQRMTPLDLSAFKTAPKSQPHAFEVDAGLNTLAHWVEEYAPNAEVAWRREGWMLSEPEKKAEPDLAAWVKANLKPPIWSAHGFHHRVQALAPTAKFVAAAKAKHGVPVAAVVLHDAVGMIEELNYSRQRLQFASLAWENGISDTIKTADGRTISYTRGHKKLSSDAIEGLLQSLENQAKAAVLNGPKAKPATATDALLNPTVMTQKEFEDKKRKGELSEDSYWAPNTNRLPDNIPGLANAPRAGEVRSKTLDQTIKPQFYQQYDEVGRKKFAQAHQKVMDRYAKKLEALDTDYAAMLDLKPKGAELFWLAFLGINDTESTAGPNWRYTQLTSRSLQAGPLGKASINWFEKIVDTAPEKHEQVILRSLVGNSTSFLPLLGQSNLSKIYDVVKSLQNSDEGGLLTELGQDAIKTMTANLATSLRNVMLRLSSREKLKTFMQANNAASAVLAHLEQHYVSPHQIDGIRWGDYKMTVQNEVFKVNSALQRMRGSSPADDNPQIKREDIELHASSAEDDLRIRATIYGVNSQPQMEVVINPSERGMDVKVSNLSNGAVLHSATLSRPAANNLLKTNLSNGIKFTSSPNTLLAVIAGYYQMIGMKQTMEDAAAAAKDTPLKSGMATMAIAAGAAGLTATGLELAAIFREKALGQVEWAKKLGKVSGYIGGVCALHDGFQALVKAYTKSTEGDYDATAFYAFGGAAIAIGGAAAIYATAQGASLAGPAGWAIALGLIGVYLIYVAVNSEDPDVAKWVARNPFWSKSSRKEPHFTSWAEEEEALKILGCGLKGELHLQRMGSRAGPICKVEVAVRIAQYNKLTQGWRLRLWGQESGKPEVCFAHQHHPAISPFPPKPVGTIATLSMEPFVAQFTPEGGLELKAVARTTVRLAKARLEFELMPDRSNPGYVLHLPMNVDDNTPNAQT